MEVPRKNALKAAKKRIAAAVAASGTSLTNIVGVGPVCAATILGYTGDVTWEACDQ